MSPSSHSAHANNHFGDQRLREYKGHLCRNPYIFWNNNCAQQLLGEKPGFTPLFWILKLKVMPGWNGPPSTLFKNKVSAIPGQF
ncbi:unnamed protein product [Caretta caretta]